jgi:hypothetical protein
MRKVNVIIERSSDGHYSAYMDDDTLDYSVIGTGATAREAQNDFYIALNEMRDLYREENREFVEIEPEFTYDVASFLAYYSNILTLAGLERLTGVNRGQLSHYITGRRHPRPSTVKKIETQIRRLGEELSHASFV